MPTGLRPEIHSRLMTMFAAPPQALELCSAGEQHRCAVSSCPWSVGWVQHVMSKQTGVRMGVQCQNIRNGHCSLRTVYIEAEPDRIWSFGFDICSMLSGYGLPSSHQHRHLPDELYRSLCEPVERR